MQDRVDSGLHDEQVALGRIFHALLSYSREAKLEVARWQRNYERLSEDHKALLPNFQSKCDSALHGVSLNQRFLTSMVQAFKDPVLAPGALEEVKRRLQHDVRPQSSDHSKVLYVLKNAVRDWAEEGAAERSQSYGRICDELQQRLATAGRVLVPGCGLGRLAFDLSRLGYHVEGNEFSFYMLVASSMVLNFSHSKECYQICPWMHVDSNHLTDADQLRLVGIPDVLPSEEGCTGSLCMSAGDFGEVYGGAEQAEKFDAVVTCFFLDCAHNIFHFIDIIHHVLKKGGIWVNLGPLLYHWSDSHTYLPQEELSIEPSLEDVQKAAQKKGFLFLQQSTVSAKFNSNVRSMVDNGYQAIFWTAQKT